MKTGFNTRRLVILGLLTAMLILFSFTPIGTIPINPTLSITLNVIPVALAAVALGPAGGAAMGAAFGILSFLQCIGVGMPSTMGIALFAVDPFLTFVQRFVPRLLDGLIIGFIFRFVSRITGRYAACFITGFLSALLNTVFFMSALVLLFGNTDYVQGLMGGKGILAYICTAIGGNAVFEMIASTIITGSVGSALFKTKLIPSDKKD